MYFLLSVRNFASPKVMLWYRRTFFTTIKLVITVMNNGLCFLLSGDIGRQIHCTIALIIIYDSVYYNSLNYLELECFQMTPSLISLVKVIPQFLFKLYNDL